MIGHESGSIVGVFRFLTTQGIQNNVDPDRVLSRTGDMGLGPSWTITKKKKNPPIMSQLQKIEKMLKLTRILLFFSQEKLLLAEFCIQHLKNACSVRTF